MSERRKTVNYKNEDLAVYKSCYMLETPSISTYLIIEISRDIMSLY
ncbi:hypothetical protein KKG24_04195 [Patescibacteria group bacterium]|nr:hypothetical protein [Patescibacteria group bacterium]